MKDTEIRQILKKTELAIYYNDTTSKIVEELKLPVAKARIDIAVINGHLHAYEIKSSSDNLSRLNSQIFAYSKVFDYITVVTEEKHYQQILHLIPNYVGVAICNVHNQEYQYSIVQPPMLNPLIEGFYIAKLLWKKELQDILINKNIKIKSTDTTWSLCEKLAHSHTPCEISEMVKMKIKNRESWKTKEAFPLK